jgi:hypothetical protein
MSENTKAATFALVDEHARMGKIGNNLERHGDTDEMLGWTLPITAMLPAEQVDALKGEYFHRSLYNINKNPWEVVEGFKDCAPLEDERTFEGVRAFLQFTIAKKELEFEGCRVTKIFYEAQLGGLTKTWFHLYVHPEIGEETSLLLEHQNSEVSITLADGKVALKKNPKQQSLPLDPPKAGAQTNAVSNEAADAVEETQEVTPESDAALDAAIGRPPAIQSRGGDAIDAELHARHPEASDEVMGADSRPDADAANGTADDPATDLARFEAGAVQAAAEFKQLARTGAIDGRSERVKHQDRQRNQQGKGEAA